MQELATTSGDQRYPVAVLDGTVHDYFGPITSHLSANGLAPHALLLARPNRRPPIIQWLTELDGEAIRLDALPAARAAEIANRTTALVSDILGEADRLERDRNTQSHLMALLLRAALEGVSVEDIMLVGDQPVFVGWGQRRSDITAGELNFGRPLLGQLAQIAARPTPPPVVVPVAAEPAPLPTPEPPPGPARLLGWPLGLLTLSVLLLLLLVGMAWLLPGTTERLYAALALPAAPVCDPPETVSPALIALRDEEARLRDRLAELEGRVGRRQLQCRIEEAQRTQPPAVQPRATPQTPAQVPPAAAEIDQRLNREQAQRGRYQVTLAWNGRADLDLYVRCPSGAVIRQGTANCGGVHDVDMNYRNRVSDEPVEHVTWQSTPPNGTYLVVIRYYDYDTRRQPVRFVVRIDTPSGSREVPGNVDNGALLQVTEFSVP